MELGEGVNRYGIGPNRLARREGVRFMAVWVEWARGIDYLILMIHILYERVVMLARQGLEFAILNAGILFLIS